MYKTSSHKNLFLYVSEAEGLSRVPQSLLCRFVDRLLVLNFELKVGNVLAKEDPEVVLRNIDQRGYHLQLPPVINI